MNGKKYFTVVTCDCGIVDKLAFQMRILYFLGVACDYQYVHTRITFERSWQTFSVKKYIDRFEKFLFFSLGICIPPFIELFIRLIEKCLNKLEVTSGSLFKYKKYNTLNKFLGLDSFDLYVNDEKFSNYSIVDIPLEKILTEHNISDISQLKDFIETFLNKNSEEICCFSAGRMYSYLFDIAQILSHSHIDINNYQFLNFSERYWKVKDKFHLPVHFDPGKLKVVIHIRRGDSMCVDLGSQKIYLNGPVISSEEFEKVLKIDAGREIEISEYESVINNMFDVFDENLFSCILISDGYELTFSRIVRAISRGKIKLNHNELKILRKIGSFANEQFAGIMKHKNVKTIIGESNDNLLKSIHAIASADVVIYGSIGFSFGVHQLFRKNKSSVMIHVKNQDDKFLTAIDELAREHQYLSKN